MNGLNGQPRAFGNGFIPIELFEDVSDDVLHPVILSANRIKSSATCYPLSGDALSDAIWQSADMSTLAFDPVLVGNTMRERKVTQTDMAKVMRLPSQSAFSNIMKGKRKVSAEEAKRAYDFLGIGGQASIQIIPVIGITNAGNWREAIQMPLGSVPVPPGKASEDAFALEINGDSMNLLIEDGGYAVIDPRQKELRDGKCYLIQNTEGEATVKCYRRSPARFEPVSSNPDHKGWLVAEVDFIVLGRVVWKGEPL